jgi:hypothetical protein
LPRPLCHLHPPRLDLEVPASRAWKPYLIHRMPRKLPWKQNELHS